MFRSLPLKAWFLAFLSWAIPFVTSFFLYDVSTKQYLPTYLTFKLIMAIELAGITYFLFRRLKSDMKKSPWQVASLFALVNVSLDLLLLVGWIGMPIAVWMLTVMPTYFFAFYGIEWLMQKNISKK